MIKMYEHSFLVDIIESKLLQAYSDYYPQNQCNNMFIKYLYKYLNDNLYVGKHTTLYNQLLTLKELSNTLNIEEATDNKTFTITDPEGISKVVLDRLNDILRKYVNCRFLIKTFDQIVFKINFGWLPPNSSGWLNLLNSETLLDYYIDGITLKPNTHTIYGDKPDSGYVCFRISELDEYSTIMFLINESLEIQGNITFASLITELESEKGATLNRIIETEPKNAFYEIGSYSRSYLSAIKTSLVIQVPYDYAFSDFLYVFDVSQSVMINPNNDPDVNNSKNWYVSFDDEDYDNKFVYNNINIEKINLFITKDENSNVVLTDNVIQYIFGDFIWKTTDYKIISYAQNLLSSLENVSLLPDGIWSDKLSELVRKFKQEENINSIFDDDVIDKETERIMISKYKLIFKADPNLLFNEW